VIVTDDEDGAADGAGSVRTVFFSENDETPTA